jgi:hypothetical protein
MRSPCALCCARHLCRFIVQSLPLILVGGIAIVMTATRGVQLVQRHVLHVLPFGSLGQFSLSDVCIGILVSGLFMMYFGACCGRVADVRVQHPCSPLWRMPCGDTDATKHRIIRFGYHSRQLVRACEG